MVHRQGSQIMIVLASMIIASIPLSVEAFSTIRAPIDLSRPSGPTSFDRRCRFAAAKKGFGNVPESTPKKKAEPKEPASSAVAAATPLNLPPKPTATTTSDTSTPAAALNPGQKALADMRRQKAESKEAELRKVREMIQADKQVQEAPAAIPEKVAQRMGTRMLGFVGVPLFLGLGSFVAFWYFATYKNIEFQPALVAGTTIAILAISLVGITYSMMSTSWDEDREGDTLGVDEFQRNVANIKEGLDRSKQNALLRDKIQGVSPAELDRVMAALDEKEKTAAAAKQKKSLGTKLQEELE